MGLKVLLSRGLGTNGFKLIPFFKGLCDCLCKTILMAKSAVQKCLSKQWRKELWKKGSCGVRGSSKRTW